MDIWRNRILIDYAQHIIDFPLTRPMGAPFIGEGEKYFSLIDDTEIEIIKALWEGEDYLRIPPPRRVIGMSCFDQKAFWKFAQALAESISDLVGKVGVRKTISVFGRGAELVLAAQATQLEEVKISCQYFPYALEKLLEYADRHPEISYLREVIKT